MHGYFYEVMGVSSMIEIKNLSFKYSVDDDYILKNINLSVHKGGMCTFMREKWLWEIHTAKNYKWNHSGIL